MVPWTDCFSKKASLPASKNLPSLVVSPAIAPPAPGGPPRTPGSDCIAAWTVSERARRNNKHCTHLKDFFLLLDIDTPFFGLINRQCWRALICQNADLRRIDFSQADS